MKKRWTMCIMIVFLSIHSFAEKISIEKAEKVAKNYLQSTLRLDTKHALQFQQAVNDERLKKGGLRQSDSEEALYYVFSVNNNQGFIIISGDDVAVPILGYSDHGNYDTANPNFAYWMECLAQEISYAIETKISQKEETRVQWQKWLDEKEIPIRELRSVVYGPLLQTQWNQTSPYNDLCPSGTYTGCVATAIAQIMKKHNTPVSRTVTIPAYTTRTNKTNIPAISGTTNYAWSSMTNTYSSTSSSAAKTAVATLMYQCGAGSQMDYTSTGSAAYSRDAALALMNYFGYDQSLQLKYRKDYSNTDWENVLRAELSAGRPVYYSGYNDASSGHAFVCDGYDSNGTYHFNWGWGGYQDGYFVTTALNPGGGGAGSGAGTYNSNQEIIINIKPNAGGAKYYELRISDSKNMTSTKASVARGEVFTVDAPVRNASLFPYTGEAGIALVNASNDQIVAIIGQKSINELGSGYYYNSPYNFNCAVPASVNAGNYKLRVVSKVSGAAQWTIISGTPGYTDVLNLTVTSEIRTHGIKIVTGSALTSSVTAINRGEAFTVSAKLGNRGTSSFTGDYGVALVDNSDRILEVTGVFRTNMTLQAGYTYNDPFTATCVVSSSITPGSYKIRAVAKPVGESWSIAYGESGGVNDIQNLTVNVTVVPDNSNLVLYNGANPTFVITPSPMSQYGLVSVGFGLYNNKGSDGLSPFVGDIELGLYNSKGELIEIIENRKMTVPNSGSYYTYTFTSSEILSPGGNYILTLYQKSVVGERKKVGNYGTHVNGKEVVVTGISPQVLSVTPKNGDTNVPINGTMVITFDKAMNTEFGEISLGGGMVMSNYRTWSQGNTVCTVPYTSLEYSTAYTYQISGFKETSGNIMQAITNGYTFTTASAPVATTWNPQSGSSVWTENANWTNGLPGVNTKVTIPAVGSYPVLTANATIGEILFAPGAELGRQDLLTYQKAFVQIDFTHPASRDRWWMLSMPLMEVYGGDFTFGGAPGMDLKTFTAGNGTATWLDYPTLKDRYETKFEAGNGFILSLSDNDRNDTGLGLANGIIELPFFDNSNVDSRVHYTHQYDNISGNSKIYKRDNNYQRTAIEEATLPRSNAAYRLAGKNVSESLAFGNHQAGYFALAGNPYMTTIDFAALQSNHSGIIKGNYRIWTGKGYTIYTHGIGTSGVVTSKDNDTEIILSSYMAPMQAFIVENVNTSVGSETLFFDVEAIGATNVNGSGLRAMNPSVNKMEITAQNSEASVRTIIANHENGNTLFGTFDTRKLFADISNVPDIYTLKPGADNNRVAVDVNVLGDIAEEIWVPLGISTTHEGEISLSFTGMDGYEANIALVDVAENRTIDLSGKMDYTYYFNYIPEKNGKETLANENRFVVRISPFGSATGSDDRSIPFPMRIYSRHAGTIQVVSSIPIQRITLYNMQGQKVYDNNRIKTSEHTIDHLAPGIYTVKAACENVVNTVKIIVK